MAIVQRGESIKEAMIEFCKHIKQRVIPCNDEIDWDYLRVEFWPDSGRIIVFPAASSIAERIEKAGCQVVFLSLLSEYDSLADSSAGDDLFVAELDRVVGLWIERFLEGFRNVGLSGFRVEFWNEGGVSPIWEGLP